MTALHHAPATRRAMLAGLAGAALAPIGAAAAPGPHPDAPLIAACAELDALEAEYRATDFACLPGTAEDGGADAQRDRITERQQGPLARVCGLPATTLAGHIARAATLAFYWPEIVANDQHDPFEMLTQALIRDLIAGGPSELAQPQAGAEPA